jgi:hypothetical protein
LSPIIQANLLYFFFCFFAAAAYFALVATISAFVGQHVVRKIIAFLGRASLIIFILALTIFVSAVSLGAQVSPSSQDLDKTLFHFFIS